MPHPMQPIPRACAAFVAGVGLAPFVAARPDVLCALLPLAGLIALPCGGLAGWRGVALAVLLGLSAARTVPHGPVLRGEGVVLGTRVGAASGREADVWVARYRRIGEPWQPGTGRVRVRFPQRPPPAGAEVLVQGKGASIATQRLPGAPDPTRDAARVGIRTRLQARRMEVLGAPEEGPRPPHDPTGMLAALTLGDRSGIDPHTVEVLRATGTAHLLAISGFHVGVMAMLAGLAARPLRRAVALFRPTGAPPVELLVGVAAAMAYAHAAQAPLSAQRAAGLLALAAAGRLAGRAVPIEALLGVVAVAVLLVDPAAVATPSFQLSFGAVLGLIRVGTPLLARLPAGRLRPISSAIAATTGATIGTLPAAAWWFQELAPLSPLANLIALPLTSTILVPAAGVATFGPAPLSGWADTVGSWAARLLVWILEPLAVEPFTPAVGPVGALVLLGALGLAHRPALATLLSVLALSLRPLPRQATITFLAVGQGDATLVEHPSGERWLVDGGAGRTDVAAYLRRRGLRRIDRVVATHNQRDHIGGLPEVVRTLRVGEVHVSDHEGLGVLAGTAERAGVPIVAAQGIHPRPGFIGDPNDRSVVLSVGDVLLTGDIEARGEAEVAARVRPHAVLKVPHHGSTTSSSPSLLDAVQPTVAVVSVGLGNPWGHPRDVILDRYRRRGIQMLRTDVHGTLVRRGAQWFAHRPGYGWMPLDGMTPPPTSTPVVATPRSSPTPTAVRR